MQMAQKFIENVFEAHINWIELIQNDDNYKNILQVKIQKEFKVTPNYLEIENDSEMGFKMGVYLCLNDPIHTKRPEQAIHVSQFKNFLEIQEYLSKNENKIFMFLGEGQHKIKRKAEQMACFMAIESLNNF